MLAKCSGTSPSRCHPRPPNVCYITANLTRHNTSARHISGGAAASGRISAPALPIQPSVRPARCVCVWCVGVCMHAGKGEDRIPSGPMPHHQSSEAEHHTATRPAAYQFTRLKTNDRRADRPTDGSDRHNGGTSKCPLRTSTTSNHSCDRRHTAHIMLEQQVCLRSVSKTAAGAGESLGRPPDSGDQSHQQ